MTPILLFDGSKTFWKTRSNLRILIVKHAEVHCLEVISYDPADAIEFPRIYLDAEMIKSKLVPEIIDKMYVEKKETFNRQKITKNREELLFSIKNQLIMQFAYARVNLYVDAETQVKSVALQASFDDVEVEGGEDGMKKLDCECIKPNSLIPFEHIAVIVRS